MTVEVDTIVAVATGMGTGAISVVRLSGPGAAAILAALSREERPPDPRVATVMHLRDPRDGTRLDQAVVIRYEAPASYTGEDVVELSCHGGWLVPQLVLDACLALGARQAGPGEFTQRAYLNGKLDLVQAEAVADLVEARSRALHRAAVDQLERGLSERVSRLRERLIRLEALLAHHIDFPEEDDAPVPVGRIVEEAGRLEGDLAALLATAPEGELLREGAVTVLAGAPNAGKSSLYNALIGEERAIVTAEPGTTRDALESVVQLDGFPFRLVDTAGIRRSGDTVERLGVEVARRRLETADVILLCMEGEPGAGEAAFIEEVPPVPIVLVRTKRDRYGGEGSGEGVLPGIVAEVATSVVTGEGLDALRALLPRLAFAGIVEAGVEAPVLTRRRHARAVSDARDQIAEFGSALAQALPPEIASVHLRRAEGSLEDLLGAVSVDEVLGAVFSEFCVGK